MPTCLRTLILALVAGALGADVGSSTGTDLTIVYNVTAAVFIWCLVALFSLLVFPPSQPVRRSSR